MHNYRLQEIYEQIISESKPYGLGSKLKNSLSNVFNSTARNAATQSMDMTNTAYNRLIGALAASGRDENNATIAFVRDYILNTFGDDARQSKAWNKLATMNQNSVFSQSYPLNKAFAAIYHEIAEYQQTGRYANTPSATTQPNQSSTASPSTSLPPSNPTNSKKTEPRTPRARKYTFDEIKAIIDLARQNPTINVTTIANAAINKSHTKTKP